jgi:formylglycine-generating enzyme required for sulfatase activity
MTYDTSDLNIAQIRKLLTEAFTADELRRFCLDHRIFQPIVAEFGPGLGLDDMVDKVIDFCRTRLVWDDLLAAVKEERLAQYTRFESGLYQSSLPPSPAPAEPHLPVSPFPQPLPPDWRQQAQRLWPRLVSVLVVSLVLLLGMWWLLTHDFGLAPEQIGAVATATTVSSIAAQVQPTNTPALTEPTKAPGEILTPMPPPSACRVGDTWTRPVDGMAMICVPAGEFLMGSSDADPDAADDEKPQHTVYLDAFWIDKTEVTNAQYRKCVEAGACKEPQDAKGDRCWDDSRYNAPDQPVPCVTWYDARDYAAWVGGRLPTEAEWEKAARGTDGRIYPWGGTFDSSKLNFCDRNCEYDSKDTNADDGYTYSAPVGNYLAGASPFGALDMAGNAWEWVADWYDDRYYFSSPASNPEGPGSRAYRVLRGGSFANNGQSGRCAVRGWGDPNHGFGRYGFRVVVVPTVSGF